MPDGDSRPARRPSALRRVGIPVVALSLAASAAQVVAATASQAATPQGRVAVGKAPQLPKGVVKAAAPAASKSLDLEVDLTTGHEAALAQYAAAVGNRNSPYYHRYLTPQEIAQDFGASAAEISAVESDLKAQGLTVNSVAPNDMLISVSGTVAQAEHAFSVTLAGYTEGSRSFYANTTAPQVDGGISGYVGGILGLDTVAYQVPQYSSTKRMIKAPAVAATSKTASPKYSVGGCADIINAYNQYNQYYGTNLQDGSGYYTSDAISNIYGITQQRNAGDDGAGVTVAVYEAESLDIASVAQIESCYGSHVPVYVTDVGAGTRAAPNFYKYIGMESALDVEDIATLAPGLTSILDYQAPDQATDAQSLATWSKMINDDKAQVISNSWGLCESLMVPATVKAENTLFEQAAAQGQTVLSAAGDSGSADCYGTPLSATAVDTSTALAVDDPASQPFVTGVGGTTMYGLAGSSPSVWNNGCQSIPNETYDACGAGAGGVSSTNSLPSYQTGTTGAAGYSANCAAAATTGCREVPDVSALADPNQGYVIKGYYDDGVVADRGYYYQIIGGTSGAAPTWAAVVAETDASTTCRLNGEAGFINPSLYAAGAGSPAFTDVTSGSNALPLGGPNYYNAGTGYDLASGWGTPNSQSVAGVLCQAPIVTPASYYVPNGPTRILDTRPGPGNTGGTVGPVKSGQTIAVQVDGQNGVPTSNVSAVVLNVTVVAPSANGYATVFPDQTKMPGVSNLNWYAGWIQPNLVVVPVGADGKIDIYNGTVNNGTANFLADEAGYFTTDSTVTGTSTYTPLTPTRELDTRTTSALTAGKSIQLQLGGTDVGSANIPTGVTAVALNVTDVASSGGGFLTVYPNQTAGGAPVTLPTVSNLNFGKGEVVANMVIVPVGADGKVDLYLGGNSGVTTNALVDVEGYFQAGTAGKAYHAISPTRLLDTRIGTGLNSPGAIGVEGNVSLALPSSYAAIVANVTAIVPGANGYVTVYPQGSNLPGVSNVNFSTGETIPNLAIVGSSNGVTLYNGSTRGTVQVVLDLAGYFS